MLSKFDVTAQVRGIWLLVALALIAGYALVWQPGQASVSSIQAHAHDLYEQANANESKVRRAAQLQVIEQRVNADLAQLAGQSVAARVTALALQLLNEEAQRFHVDVRTIAPETRASPPPTDRLVGQSVTVGIRGRFRDIVELIADLPHNNVLIDVRDVELAAVDTMHQSEKPVLEATVRATLYRLRPDLHSKKPEDPHATAALR
jgi:Tfp pilus assembly protein PilO